VIAGGQRVDDALTAALDNGAIIGFEGTSTPGDTPGGNAIDSIASLVR